MQEPQIDPVKYGVLWQKVTSMEEEVSELRKDVRELLELANKGRGGFWAGMVLVSAASSIVGYITHNWFGK